MQSSVSIALIAGRLFSPRLVLQFKVASWCSQLQQGAEIPYGPSEKFISELRTACILLPPWEFACSAAGGSAFSQSSEAEDSFGLLGAAGCSQQQKSCQASGCSPPPLLHFPRTRVKIQPCLSAKGRMVKSTFCITPQKSAFAQQLLRKYLNCHFSVWTATRSCGPEHRGWDPGPAGCLCLYQTRESNLGLRRAFLFWMLCSLHKLVFFLIRFHGL